ncbi:hypothetical protein M8494_35920 [Serratia ureilytica]
MPRWPLVELPVRLTGHGADRFADVARRRFLISSAVMVDTPGACRFCRAAVTTMVSSPRGASAAPLFSSVVGVSVCCAALANADAPSQAVRGG